MQDQKEVGGCIRRRRRKKEKEEGEGEGEGGDGDGGGSGVGSWKLEDGKSYFMIHYLFIHYFPELMEKGKFISLIGLSVYDCFTFILSCSPFSFSFSSVF